MHECLYIRMPTICTQMHAYTQNIFIQVYLHVNFTYINNTYVHAWLSQNKKF